MSTANCWVKFWENKNFASGGYREFTGPVNIPDLSKDYWDNEKENVFNEMDDAISSMQTGSQAWIKVFSQANYGGAEQLYGPNTSCQDLGAMDNTIASFQLYDNYPVNQTSVTDNFAALYDARYEQKFAGASLEFYTQDCHYRVYLPSMEQVGNVMNFTLNLDYDRSGGFDDHAVATFSMDTSGNFVDSIKISYDMGSSAYQIPQWAIDFIDDGIEAGEEAAIEMLDGAEIVLTLGVGTELIVPTDILILAAGELLTIGVNHINDVIDKMFGLTDAGGTMYFSSTVSQAVARCVYAYYQTLFGADSGPLVTFDNSLFASFFNASWATDKNSPYVLFDNGGQPYRAYCPDSTSIYAKAGMIASLKIDAINDNAQDDHLILFTTFDPTGKLFSVQGSIDIYGAPADGDTDTYQAPSSGTIAYDKNGHLVQITQSGVNQLTGYASIEDAWKALMQTALANVEDGKSSASLKNVVNAAYQVLQGIEASTS